MTSSSISWVTSEWTDHPAARSLSPSEEGGRRLQLGRLLQDLAAGASLAGDGAQTPRMKVVLDQDSAVTRLSGLAVHAGWVQRRRLGAMRSAWRSHQGHVQPTAPARGQSPGSRPLGQVPARQDSGLHG